VEKVMNKGDKFGDFTIQGVICNKVGFRSGQTLANAHTNVVE
jgi:hypothetical protein